MLDSEASTIFQTNLQSQRVLLLQGTDSLSRASESIERSQRIAAETDQIGTDIIEELGEQREQLQRTKSRVSRMGMALRHSAPTKWGLCATSDPQGPPKAQSAVGELYRPNSGCRVSVCSQVIAVEGFRAWWWNVCCCVCAKWEIRPIDLLGKIAVLKKLQIIRSCLVTRLLVKDFGNS